MTNENNGDKESCLVEKEDDDVKRRLWRRFCPKLWFSTIWKKLSISPKMIGVKTFLEKNAISASIALALGLCYLLPKLKGSKCIVAPYSDLLVGIRDGSVTRVQFKENSRSVFYKRNLQTIENEPVSHENSFSRKNGVLKLNIQDILADMLRIFSRGREAMPKHDQEKRGPVLCNQVPNSEWQFSTRYVDDDYRDLLALMKEKGTTYGLDPEPLFISAGRRVLTTLLNQAPSWAMLLFIARGLGGGDSIARKPNKKQMVTFDDVEGVDAAKIELMEIVSCLQGDTTYSNLGAKVPRGVLLVGPPGTGKTLLARAVAEKAGVPFFITCASEFMELFVGRGASRIRNLFKDARKHAPSIIFIDELDAVGLKRGKGFNTEGDQTLNQLLTEMDGFESDKKVVVIAATNRAEMLDPALLRPGRFSRKVYVREPDEDGRRKILAVHFRGVPLEEDKTIICNLVASLTQGFVGADLANIVNEAALLAGRRGANCVSREDIMEAIKRAKVVIRDSQHQHRERYEQEGREIVLSLTNGGFDSHGLE